MREDAERSPQETDDASPKVDESSCLGTVDRDGKKAVRFYWIDAVEDTYNNKGTVYMFGKVQKPGTDKYESCCVTVQNIERSMFFVPREWRVQKGQQTGALMVRAQFGYNDYFSSLTRTTHADEEVTMTNLYTEVQDVMHKYRVDKWLAKPVERKYAFDFEDVPAKFDCLKVKVCGYCLRLLPPLEHNIFNYTRVAVLVPAQGAAGATEGGEFLARHGSQHWVCVACAVPHSLPADGKRSHLLSHL